MTFGCSAKHDKNIEYHWRHNNETIKKDARCVIHDDGTLAITNVRLEDRGAYQCYVTIVGGGNILGESKTAALDVKGKLTVSYDAPITVDCILES